MEVDQVADVLHGSHLQVRQQQFFQLLRRNVRRDRQDEEAGVDQGPVVDACDVNAVFALLQRELHAVLLQHHGEHPLDIVHQRVETLPLAQVVVEVLGVQALLLLHEDRQLRRQGVKFQEEFLGMHLLLAVEEVEAAVKPVEQLQQEVVAQFGGLDAGVAELLGHLLHAVFEGLDQLFDLAAQVGAAVQVQVGRPERGVEADRPVGRDGADAGDGDRFVPFVELMLAEDAEVVMRHQQFRQAAFADVGVGHFPFPPGNHPRVLVLLLFEGEVVGMVHPQRQRQVEGAPRIGAVDLGDQRVGLRRHFKEGPVGHDPRRTIDDETPGIEQLVIDFEGEKAPAVGTGLDGPGHQLVMEMPVVLLKMLRADKEPFPPDNAAVHHSTSRMA